MERCGSAVTTRQASMDAGCTLLSTAARPGSSHHVGDSGAGARRRCACAAVSVGVRGTRVPHSRQNYESITIHVYTCLIKCDQRWISTIMCIKRSNKGQEGRSSTPSITNTRRQHRVNKLTACLFTETRWHHACHAFSNA